MNFTFALRLVIGWTYFSAFWRRIVLENKLDPEAIGYIGEKFNHFLPHALFIKGPIEFLLTHPDLLMWVMIIFTIIEGVCGLLFMLGAFTRWMSLVVMGLAMGILLSAGWIGTTCLDEWQIGVLGLTGGLTIFLSGGGKYSLDHYLKLDRFDFPFMDKIINAKVIVGSAALMLFITLATNQIFHGGVWGELHNKSVKPKLEITNLVNKADSINFEVMRVEGADVYGSFLYKLEVIDTQTNEVIQSIRGEEWKTAELHITNKYIAKIKPHHYSLVIPLGAKATITLPKLSEFNGPFKLLLTDINGSSWEIQQN